MFLLIGSASAICTIDQYQEPSCVIAGQDVVLKADLSGDCNLSEVFLRVEFNENTTEVVSPIFIGGTATYNLDESKINAGDSIKWNYFLGNDGLVADEQSFFVYHKTNLNINPSSPDGLDSWYIKEPSFELNNIDDDTSVHYYYRWDNSGEFEALGDFGLENTPNNNELTGGILELNWWSDICGKEEEQSEIFYFDFASPKVDNVYPGNSTTISNLNVTISASLYDPYGSNSGVDESQINLDIDDNPIINFKYKNGVLSYDAELEKGFHRVTITVKDNAGNIGQKIWSFMIDPSEVDLEILSPISEVSDEKRQLFDIKLDQDISKLEYIDLNELKPRWKLLCSNCDRYQSKLILKEGQHNIVIRAINYAGVEFNDSVSFFIDSVKPKIVRQDPIKGYSNGLFKVKYNEENPTKVIIHYKQDGIRKDETREDCPGGRNQLCEFYLSDLLQGDLTYYFEIIDISGNSVEYIRPSTVEVDTVSPNLMINSMKDNYYKSKVPLDIRVDENVNIYYRDNNDRMPRWKLIATNKMEFRKDITFLKGDHEVEFKAVDKAGNIDIELVRFNVVY